MKLIDEYLGHRLRDLVLGNTLGIRYSHLEMGAGLSYRSGHGGRGVGVPAGVWTYWTPGIKFNAIP